MRRQQLQMRMPKRRRKNRAHAIALRQVDRQFMKAVSH